MNLLWMGDTPALHVFCTYTHFGNAMSLPSKSAKDIWLTFLHCWNTVYITRLNKVRSDRESGVNSALFNDPKNSNRIALQLFPGKGHNAIGTGERYHDSLQRIYQALHRSHPVLTSQLTLPLAVKSLNDTMSSEELVLPFLVFEVLSSLPIHNKPLTSQTKGMVAMALVHIEMRTTTAELCIKRDFLLELPPANKHYFKPGDLIKVYNRQEKKWCRPVTMVWCYNKQVTESDGIRTKTHE